MARAPRYKATVFIGDVTSPDVSWRVPTDESSPLGVTRDWSETGVFVETPSRPAIGSIIELTFVWGDDPVRSKARVVRHAKDGIGLTFVDPGPAFVFALRGILSEALG
jgi:hypothetical protein